MTQNSFVEMMTGLTDDQQKAIQSLLNIQKKRMHIGISYETIASDFRALNTLRKTDSFKADAREEEWFAICNYDPKKT